MNYQSGITHHSLMRNQSCRRHRSRKYIVHGIVAVNQQRHTGADRLAPTSGVRVGQQLTYDPTGVPNGSRLSRRPSGHAASPHTDAGRCGHASSKSSRTHHVRDMRGRGDTMSRRTTSPPHHRCHARRHRPRHRGSARLGDNDTQSTADLPS